MGICGCFPACSCQLNVEPPELLTLSGNGDPLSGGWLLTALETVFSATNNDGAVQIAPGGAYGHSPEIDLIISDTDSVDLATGGSGLEANVRIDPASPVPIDITNDGLSISSVPSAAGGLFPGVVLDYYGAAAPSGWLLCYGQLVSIATYSDLFNAIGHAGSGGVDPGGGQFTIPDLRGRVTVGLDNMGGVDAGRLAAANTLGGVGGTESAQLAVANLPAHTHTETGSHNHPVVDPGHGHGVTDGGHSHTASTSGAGNHTHAPSAGRSFITAESATLQQVRFQSNAGGNADLVVDTNDPNTVYGQKNNANTDASGDHSHAVTVNGATTGIAINANATGISVGQNTDLVTVGGGGNGAALGNSFLILQPYQLVNKIIKA